MSEEGKVKERETESDTVSEREVEQMTKPEKTQSPQVLSSPAEAIPPASMIWMDLLMTSSKVPLVLEAHTYVSKARGRFVTYIVTHR